MPLGEAFNPLDSFGNQIWQADSNPRTFAKAFLLYLSGEVKAGRVPNATAIGMLSRLREAISPSARISWNGYVPTTCCVKQDRQTNIVLSEEFLIPEPISQEDLRKIDEVKSSIEKFVEASGGSQRVLSAIEKNKWPDASTWEFDGKKFSVVDVKVFAEIEESKIKMAKAPLPEKYNQS